MGPIGCPETSVRSYHSTLCNMPEERRSHISNTIINLDIQRTVHRDIFV